VTSLNSSPALGFSERGGRTKDSVNVLFQEEIISSESLLTVRVKLQGKLQRENAERGQYG